MIGFGIGLGLTGRLTGGAMSVDLVDPPILAVTTQPTSAGLREAVSGDLQSALIDRLTQLGATTPPADSVTATLVTDGRDPVAEGDTISSVQFVYSRAEYLDATVIVDLSVVVASSFPPQVMGISFLPMGNINELNFSVAELSSLGVTHIRIAENWENKTETVTPSSFANLNFAIDAFNSAGIEVMLTVQSSGPASVCVPSKTNQFGCVFQSDAPFEEYLTTLLGAVGDKPESVTSQSRLFDLPIEIKHLTFI